MSTRTNLISVWRLHALKFSVPELVERHRVTANTARNWRDGLVEPRASHLLEALRTDMELRRRLLD